jgi:hypothetical protein
MALHYGVGYRRIGNKRGENRMMRVVDVLPDREKFKTSRLIEKDFWIDPDTYRHFVEQFHRDYLAYERTRTDGHPAVNEAADGRLHGKDAAQDNACIEAFDRCRPPYHYHRGSIYRYRIDPTGPVDRPIILESLERTEVTGALLGIPFTSQRQGFLMRLSLWIEKKLREREEKQKG